MAHTRNDLAPIRHYGRKHWGLVGYKGLASQDNAQEVQIRYSDYTVITSGIMSLLDVRKQAYITPANDIGSSFAIQ